MSRPYCVAETYDPMTRGLVPYVEVAGRFADLLSRFGRRVRSILEIACGTGNLTLPLVRLGYRVTGLDVSPQMIAVARRKAAARGLEIRFLCQDLSDPYPGPRVDAVLCFYGGLNFLSSPQALRRGFEAVHAALGAAGLFVFDQFSQARMRDLFTGDVRRRWPGFTVATRSRARHDGRIDHRVTFDLRRGGGTRREIEIHRLRIHPFDEIAELLSETGFELLAVEELDRPLAAGILKGDHLFVARRVRAPG